ncbi:MAG: ribosome small subunit-dependent GTPase A [Oscillospiraceae bacterium]|nr:ribosome small subunit-dependent GTPase A [Oscillospiraceae bacterium]
MSRGRIEKALSGFYYVDVAGQMIVCRARGKFRQEGRSPLVGDWVEVREVGPDQGMVWEIEPRRTVFDRPAVANVDQLVVVASAAVPVTDPFLIDRVAAIAALKDCGVVVCVNKCDLAPGEELAAVYRLAGFPVVRTSAETGEGVAELVGLLGDKLSAFTGNSGVGKSSLLNAIQPDFSLRVAAVSEKLGRGKHTTRHVELYRLDCGAGVIDTPGFSSFDAQELDLELKEHLPECFLEFRPYLEKCRFVGCSHTKEKGCAVLHAVKAGEIPRSRHESYVRLYNELKDLRAWSASRR